MSNNKYIIDEDSLTGIADAVRDVLGTGVVTTDSQTGDIVYPEDKGYYLKYMYPVQWTNARDSDTWSGTGTSYAIVAKINETQMLRVCNGVRPVYVKIDVILDNAYDGIVVENSLTNWSDSNHIVTLPVSGQFLCKYSYYHSSYYSSGTYYQKTIPAVTFSFLDENQEIIVSEDSSYIADAMFYSKNLPQESISGPIPFTIDDIQDKITNYLVSATTVQTFPFDGYYHGNNTTDPFVNLSSVFSSKQDLLDRLYNFCIFGLPGTLLIGADGHPVSMKKEGVPLPSNIVSGYGGWNMTDVATAYNNDQVFRYHYRDPNASSNTGDAQLAYIYIPSSTATPFIIFCLDNTIGYRINGTGSNNKMIMYRRAQNESS